LIVFIHHLGTQIFRMEEKWSNWSGSVSFRPSKIEKPSTEEQVRQLVVEAREKKQNIRIVGSGHSSVPLVETQNKLISQENLKGLTGYNKEKIQVDFLPGTTIEEAGNALIRLRMDMHNTGDVDFQTLGGAFGTGTHGSGLKLPNLSAMLIGCRLVDGNGEIREFDREKNPEMMRALRVSMGALGFFTEVKLQVEKAQQYVRKEYCTHVDTGLEHLEELLEENEMFDFYWYPRNDLVKLRIGNEVGKGMQDVPFAELEKETSGWLYEILPQFRDLKYEEMEYIVPLEAGPDCFRAVRKRIKEKHRHYVGWRTLYRAIAADDAYLSPFRQDSVSIAILQNHELEYKAFFDDLEPVFRDFGGRPHWGKKHSLRAEDLEPLFPEWEKFRKVRQELDPEGVFLNDYLKNILGK
jgi:FAD/FMN-containing dehydrogenase